MTLMKNKEYMNIKAHHNKKRESIVQVKFLFK